MKSHNNEVLIDFIIQGIIERLLHSNKNISILKFREVFLEKYKSNINSLSDELSKINNNLNKLLISDDLILHSDNYIELPIYFPEKLFKDLYFYSPDIKALTYQDHENCINYEMSGQSMEYTLLLLNALKTFYDNNKIGLMDHSIHHIFDYYLDSFNTDTGNGNNHLIQKGLSTYTIKITVNKTKEIEYLLQLAYSFMFQIMYKFKTACIRFSNMENLLQQSDFHRGIGKNSSPSNLQIPRLIYRDYIIDYYSVALSSIDPFAQYLSYYHIIEYFFDLVFDQKILNYLKSTLEQTSNFSINEKKHKDLIKTLKAEIKKNNELESLKLVLKEYININELQDKLSKEQIEYFQQNKVSFSHAQTIFFNHNQNSITHLAQRIYQTRNALVHSKESNVRRYKPYQDSEELIKEIPLIKLVAEQVIINSSTPL